MKDVIPIDYIKSRIAYREFLVERYGDCATKDDKFNDLLNILKHEIDCLKDLILVWELAGRLDPDYGEEREEMKEYEIWYQFCMPCKHSYISADDADTVYCNIPKELCPHREEIENAEQRKEE